LPGKNLAIQVLDMNLPGKNLAIQVLDMNLPVKNLAIQVLDMNLPVKNLAIQVLDMNLPGKNLAIQAPPHRRPHTAAPPVPRLRRGNEKMGLHYKVRLGGLSISFHPGSTLRAYYERLSISFHPGSTLRAYYERVGFLASSRELVPSSLRFGARLQAGWS